MGISAKIKSVFRGNAPFHVLAREVLRRRKDAARRRDERRNLAILAAAPPRLLSKFASLSAGQLHKHFVTRTTPMFWPPEHGDAAELIETANRIASDSSWELAGFGVKTFTGENVWRRDPVSGKDWSLDYHAEVTVHNNDGSDIRVLWELNRLGHVVPLACSFAATRDEKYAETFFSHVEGWMTQNPYACGANWNCAMEVALRAINLLAAFDIFRVAAACTEERLITILKLFDQHGRFIEDNNEFSYLATSNHYLSNVVGLFWLGTLLPELEHAKRWREFGLAEMLHEIDVQILPDGADFEASTGYHAFVVQMLLYTFLLAKRNGIEIAARYWSRVRDMLDYLHGILRPAGGMPLIGDADGSQIIPIIRRDAEDQQYLIELGAVVFGKSTTQKLAPEVFWLLGKAGTDNETNCNSPSVSAAFSDAGAYVMSDGDLYLHFNTNDCGVNGRGSHAHNDALSIEVSAFGRQFIIDPGSYVYNLDREARHLFRSTGYHSTVMIDDLEQNTIETELPFIIGNQSRPQVLEWTTDAERDRVSAEHFGYTRLANAVVHRRVVQFEKAEKFWLIEDSFKGNGSHEFTFSFHIAPGLSIEMIDTYIKIADVGGNSFVIDGFDRKPEIVAAFRSLTYGHREETQIIRWKITGEAPMTKHFSLIRVAANERLESRLAVATRFAENTSI